MKQSIINQTVIKQSRYKTENLLKKYNNYKTEQFQNIIFLKQKDQINHR